jgi:hypothetical protein
MPHPDNFNAAASGAYPTRSQRAAESQGALNEELDNAQLAISNGAYGVAEDAMGALDTVLGKLMHIACIGERATQAHLEVVATHKPKLDAAAAAFALAVAEFRIAVEGA